jgi:peroxin-1
MDSCVSKVMFVISCRAMKSLAVEVTEFLACHACVELEPLSSDERSKLVDSMLNIGLPSVVDLVSSMTEGYRVKDLHVVTTRINHVSTNLGHSEEFFKSILDEYVPLSRQGLNIEVGREHQEWCNIGGIFEAKDKLKAAILNPVKYRRIYERAPIQLPKGILLFGPPGCGKSYLVPALAKECGHTLITCRGPELLDRYIGASEANVRQLLERARSAAPSILFLDEFDSLAPRRGSDNTGVTDRVVNQLLTYLDGVETMLQGVFLVAATSRPDKIDPALLRPGRLDQHIYVGYPDSSVELRDILVKMMAQRQTATKLLDSFLDNSFVLDDDQSGRLANLSPADIKAVLDTAHLEAIHEYFASPQTEPVEINESHVRKALLATRASISLQDRAMLEKVYQPFITSTRVSYAKETNSDQVMTSLK